MSGGLTFLLACLSACLSACFACLHSPSPTSSLSRPPAASQPIQSLHFLPAVTAACTSHTHSLSRATHAPAQPSLTFCPVHARARQRRSVAQRERGSTARPPAARSAGSCLALEYRQPRLCLRASPRFRALCYYYSNNTVTPACPCARQSIDDFHLPELL